MFSSQIIPTRGDFIRRGTDDTDESPFSSGLTTPADEEVLQSFDNLLAAELRSSRRLGSRDSYSYSKDGSATPPKSRSLSKAVMKAKQFAQYLKSNRMSKKTKSSMSDFALAVPVLAAPASVDVVEDTTGSTSALTTATHSDDKYYPKDPNDRPAYEANFDVKQPIFTQPNQPIEQLSFTPDTINQLSSVDAALNTYCHQDILETPPTTSTLAKANSPPSEPAARSLTAHDAQALCTKLLLFLPWCVLVGATMVLFPTHLEPIVFGSWPGYQASPGTPSPKGIYRFSVLADCAMQHVMIFLGCLAALAWCNLSVGIFVGAAVVAQFMHAWGDFRLDRSVMLGEDDRQTVFLVCMRGGFEDGVVVRQSEGGYLAIQGGDDIDTVLEDDDYVS